MDWVTSAPPRGAQPTLPPGSACALLAQVDIPLNPSWVPWPKREGRNSLGILGVLHHPAFLPAGLWQGGLLNTWLDAALHTPS